MGLPFNFEKWTVEQTCQYLREEGLQEWQALKEIRDDRLRGDRLRDLTVDALKDMGIHNPDDRERILHHIKKLWQIQSKVFNDPIHGHVELHPLLIKIIDTPQFQRLRNIKQLGGLYFVYPGASHNRFEHSIGVAHLAGQLAEALRTRQPRLNIDDRDILCVQIAGLCHDLGHGPFSHLYDRMFIPRAYKEKKDWKHEDASVEMFCYMVKSNNLKPVMKYYHLELPKDLFFILEMINGPLKKEIKRKILKDLEEPDTSAGQDQEEPDPDWQYEGRPKKMSFLYEIVANKTTGVDVDKFDYFARDSYHLGIQSNFDHRRFLKFARVCEVDGQNHICIRDKEEDNMSEMFHTRFCLHRRAYQHKTNKIIETMITEAFLRADGHIWFDGSNRRFTLSEAIVDMKAYTKLTDHSFWQILSSTGPEPARGPAPCLATGPVPESASGAAPGPGPAPGPGRTPDLAEAKKILNRIISRDLYKFLGETRSKIPIEEMKWKEELAQKLPDRLTPEDFEVMVIKMDYGMKDKDPIDEMYFYSKSDTTKAFKRRRVQVSRIRPTIFSERLIRFYCRKTDKVILEAVSDFFPRWCREKNFPEYQD